MKLQGKVQIKNRRKMNSEKHDTYKICATQNYRNGFAYNMNKLICEN